jgi:carbonic anhydrase
MSGEVLAGGQNPFPAVLGRADSRIAPEYAFDTGRSDLFVCRVAGNFASDEDIAGLEYAVSVQATPLILVLDHDACGAVDATIKEVAKGRQDLAGTFAVAGHGECAVCKSDIAVDKRCAQRRDPAKRDRQRRQTEIDRADP